MREIMLTQGYAALVDNCDFALVNNYKWFAIVTEIKSNNSIRIMAATNITVDKNKHRILYMHRLIMQPEGNKVVDHKDGDCLNNIRSNLRVCSQTENKQNRKKYYGTSKYKGVCKPMNKNQRKIRKREWLAQIRANGKSIRLGMFATEIEAAMAYDAAAIKYHGEFASTNSYD